jgi:SAM-dependent methyltransferase
MLPQVRDAVQRMAGRNLIRTEADIQADIYVVLTSGALNLNEAQVRLESPSGDGTRRRLDVEIGLCAIEVKKDLRPAGIRAEAITQLAGYVGLRSQQLSTRYTGVLTDGMEWLLYAVEDDVATEIARLELDSADPDAERLVSWLETILSTEDSIRPTPDEIRARLGAESPGHLLDHATLASIYEHGKDFPEVRIKRNLWAKLLRTAFGDSFVDDVGVFVDHTLLVLTAEAIAHAVVGIDVSKAGNLTADELTAGSRFSTDAQIHGVVESDFFDWVLNVEGGAEFVKLLAHRVSRFDWTEVEHDVLKHLYESVISQEARESLGEYYTPDWLANRMVANSVTDPLNQRVLDPSCGSGTFLFHAVRAFFISGESAGLKNGEMVARVTGSVLGVDIHPVAVTLARVTYLLAIGTERLAAADRGPISIPVYLGDSLQWEQHRDIWSSDDLVRIETTSDELVGGSGGGTLFDDDLVFPRRILENATVFDLLVSEMSTKALDVTDTLDRTLIRPILQAARFGLLEDERGIIAETFATMRRLHRSGRNHIWGYYVRNLIRPLWLATIEQRVDVLVGNPPWLRYSKMTVPMQERFKRLAKERQLLTGGLGASARDLSTLFVVRSIELYLRSGGAFSFVMPHGTMSRRPHVGFRTGNWSGTATGSAFKVQFEQSWDTHLTPTGFPMASCVIHGRFDTGPAAAHSDQVQVWSATTLDASLHWEEAEPFFSIRPGVVVAVSDDENRPVSPYKKSFRQGAIVVPRMVFMVEEQATTALGAGAGRTPVKSRRSSLENPPYRDFDSITGTVESSYIRPVLIGESLAPYRVIGAVKAVVPISEEAILTQSQVAALPGLDSWWDKVEEVWKRGRATSETLDLLERFDYNAQMSSQLPLKSNRVVYTKSGARLVAARVKHSDSVVDHTLYWASASSQDEARYLVGILNSEMLRVRVAPLQPIGNFGPRHFDKYVFEVPFGTFDSANDDHLELVMLVTKAEAIAAGVDVSGLSGVIGRRTVAAAVAAGGIGKAIESVVARILPETAGLRAAGAAGLGSAGQLQFAAVKTASKV